MTILSKRWFCVVYIKLAKCPGCIFTTLPETNIAPENRPSQKETSIPTIHFQGGYTLLVTDGAWFLPSTVAINQKWDDKDSDYVMFGLPSHVGCQSVWPHATLPDGTKGIYCSTNHPIHIPHTMFSLFTYMHLCKNTRKFCPKKKRVQTSPPSPLPERLWSSSPWRLRQSPNLLRRGDCLPPEGRWFSPVSPLSPLSGLKYREVIRGFSLGLYGKQPLKHQQKVHSSVDPREGEGKLLHVFLVRPS